MQQRLLLLTSSGEKPSLNTQAKIMHGRTANRQCWKGSWVSSLVPFHGSTLVINQQINAEREM
jgi:hypothetical protein